MAKSKSILVDGVYYNRKHIATKETFKKLFGKNPQWESIYAKIKALKK